MTLFQRRFVFLAVAFLCIILPLAGYMLYYAPGKGLPAAGQNTVIPEKTAAAAQANVAPATKPVIDKNLPELILVNKAVHMGANQEPADLRVIHGVYLRKMAADALQTMLDAAEREGIHGLVVYSGYRSYQTQVAVYANKIASLRPEYGDQAETMAQKLVAPPGASEHQTGLAVDLTLREFLDYEYVLNYDFANTPQGRWLRDNSWKYGFILRYDDGKEAKTNIDYEPWHFRYVGLEHAKKIYELGVCLEEYLSM